MLMNKTEMRMWRWIQGVSLREHKRNEEISEAATVQPIATHLMQKRLRWYGHVRRRDDSYMTRTVLAMVVEGVRPRGRPTLRYMDTIKRYLKRMGGHTSTVSIARTGDWQCRGRPTDVEESSRREEGEQADISGALQHLRLRDIRCEIQLFVITY